LDKDITKGLYGYLESTAESTGPHRTSLVYINGKAC